MPTVLGIWGGAIVLGLVGFAAARFRRWLVIPALGLIAIVAWSRLGKLADPTVGPAIVQACAALALAVILAVLGVVPKRTA